MADSSDKVFIWSDEHNAYWRHNGAGYTVRIGGAGLYDRAEAEKILRGVGPEKRLVIEEIPVWARALEAEVYNRAIEEAAALAEDRHETWQMSHPDDAGHGEVCDDISACRDIAGAIRALAKEVG